MIRNKEYIAGASADENNQNCKIGVTLEYNTWRLGWVKMTSPFYNLKSSCDIFANAAEREALLFTLDAIIAEGVVAQKSSPDNKKLETAIERCSAGMKYFHDTKCDVIEIKAIIVKIEPYLKEVVSNIGQREESDRKLTELIEYCKTK